MDRLAHLYHEFGQSPWLDNLKRGYITSGQLGHLVDKGIRGLTSNPTIFQKAIQGSPDYDEQFKKLAAGERPDHRRLLGNGARRHQRRPRCVRRAVSRQPRRPTVTPASRWPPIWPTTPPAPSSRSTPSPRADPPAESDGEDPRHGRGRARHPGHDRRRPQHQRHADLQPRSLPGGDRGVHRGLE